MLNAKFHQCEKMYLSLELHDQMRVTTYTANAEQNEYVRLTDVPLFKECLDMTNSTDCTNLDLRSNVYEENRVCERIKNKYVTGMMSKIKDYKGITWVNITGIVDEEVMLLERALGLHPLTSEDIIIAEPREKFETFPHYSMACVCFSDKDKFETCTDADVVFLIMLPEILVSICTLQITNPDILHKRINKLMILGLRLTPEWASYLIIDEIISNFAPMVQYIHVTIESIDDLSCILKSQDKSEMMIRISEIRKKTSYIYNMLSGKSNLVFNIYTHFSSKSQYSGCDLDHYFIDLKELTTSLTQKIENSERTLVRARKNYYAQILIELTDSSKTVNDSAMRMSAIACVMFPSSIVTGLFGMNVIVPGQERGDLMWFFSILIFMAVITICMFIWMKRKKIV